MDSEGYPTDKELKQIKNWDVKDTIGLIGFLRDLWTYDNHFIEKWKKGNYIKERYFLELKLITGGWSGNESIINALRQNDMFWILYWEESRRGGFYKFEIDFYKIGFELVSEYAKSKKISRQCIYDNRWKYDWISISQNKRLIRPKTNAK